MTSTTSPAGVGSTGAASVTGRPDRFAATDGGPPGVDRRPGRADLVLAGVTVVAVPVGTVLGGAELSYDGVLPMTTWLVLMLLVRHRWPVTALLASLAVILAFRGAELTSVGWAWPASAAFYLLVAGERDRRNGLAWAVGAGTFQLLYAVNWDWTVTGLDGARAFAQVGAEALWLALLVAVALAYRNWERWRSELAAGLARAAHERRLEADRRAVEERLRIARELHDVVAHTLTVVGVQLRVVDEALEDSPEEARKALRTAQEVRARAVNDLGSLVRLLRQPDDRAGTDDVPAPQADLDGLDDLLDRTRGSGLDVVVDSVGGPADLPAPVALAAYRVIQEALTNTVRHAGAGRVTVRLRYTAETLSVEVVDDGTGPGPAATPGHGLRGMRERVAALGGTFEAGAADPCGYLVRASFPVGQFRS
ncbi:sensor histidine kinase [Plantactinospora sonchi]|uniref:histidine kinase n=1 Tax=Plantactinospora sonchi TaxID=1544735 RepID=A0ABU7RM34_9ACTN